MTVPLRAGEAITVKVALGERSYDIAIGRGLLGSLGARMAGLRPGARTALGPAEGWCRGRGYFESERRRSAAVRTASTYVW